MKKVNYDRVALDERRRVCEEENSDVLVWTNDRVIKWISFIGLKVRRVTQDAALFQNTRVDETCP